MEGFLIAASFISILLIIYAIILLLTKENGEKEKKLKESLSDESLYDPETGLKFSLADVEGIDESDLEQKYPHRMGDIFRENFLEQEVEFEEIVNYIRKTNLTLLDENKIDWLIETIISKTKIANNPDEELFVYNAVEVNEYIIIVLVVIDYIDRSERQLLGIVLAEDFNLENRMYRQLVGLLNQRIDDITLEKIEDKWIFKINKPVTVQEYEQLISTANNYIFK